MINKLPEEKRGRHTRACKPARIYSGHPELRCGSCPFPDCYKDNPAKMRQYFLVRIGELQDALWRYCA